MTAMWKAKSLIKIEDTLAGISNLYGEVWDMVRDSKAFEVADSIVVIVSNVVAGILMGILHMVLLPIPSGRRWYRGERRGHGENDFEAPGLITRYRYTGRHFLIAN